MKVRNLIARLAQFDPDAEARFAASKDDDLDVVSVLDHQSAKDIPKGRVWIELEPK